MTCPRLLIVIDPVYGLSTPAGPVQPASGKLGYGAHAPWTPGLGPVDCVGLGLADCGAALASPSACRPSDPLDAAPGPAARPGLLCFGLLATCVATTTAMARAATAAAVGMAMRLLKPRGARRSP